MTKVVGVRVKEAGIIQPYLADGAIYLHDFVIVEWHHLIKYGQVVTLREATKEDEALPTIKRIATDQDDRKEEENKRDAKEAIAITKHRIEAHQLPMKLIDIEYSFDRNKMLFYFTADGRIDFRQLVKDLASIFKTRIELRQVGVRDEAKLLGGIGPCGRPLCCHHFLGDFMPVSIKMAKDQRLSLNPAKISGVCGRLMCCLKYENDEYEQAKKEMPDVGQTVMTDEGTGVVVDVNLLMRTLKVKLSGHELASDYSMDEIKEMRECHEKTRRKESID